MAIDQTTLKEMLKEQRKEFQQYVGVMDEEFQSRLKGVAELVSANAEKLGKQNKILEAHNRVLIRIDTDSEVIRRDIEFIKKEVGKKSGCKDLAGLEKRLSALEANQFPR